MAQRWDHAPMVALDLECSGSQDRNGEMILEIALVPISGGRPALDQAWQSLVNPGRRIPRHPWISPGLTNEVLAQAPPWHAVEPAVRHCVHEAVLVGHNVRVDWRLLRRHSPRSRPAALLERSAWPAPRPRRPSRQIPHLPARRTRADRAGERPHPGRATASRSLGHGRCGAAAARAGRRPAGQRQHHDGGPNGTSSLSHLEQTVNATA